MSGGDPLATCRNIPLDRVAAALGYRQDPADRARFRREGSVISINGEKFFDHLRATGGGGAIDLVIHATGWGFPEALRFLARHQGRGKAAALKPAPRRLRLPKPSHRAWPRVRDALVRQRALRADVLEACHSRGLLYADDCASREPARAAPSSPQPPVSPARSQAGSKSGNRSASSVPTTPTAPVTTPAERLAVSDPRVIRLRPRGAKDWNEILLRSR